MVKARVAAGLAVAVWLWGQSAEPKDGSLAGTVVNSATGQPVSAVELRLAASEAIR